MESAFNDFDEEKLFKSMDYPLATHHWNIPKVPRDAEGFVTSFGIDEEENYQKFFDEFGFVVVKNVLSNEEVNATVDEIWSLLEGKNQTEGTHSRADLLYLKAAELEKEGKPFEAVEYYMKAYALKPELENEEENQRVLASIKSKVNRDDPSTWENRNWPSAQSVGMMGGDVAKEVQAWSNRQNPNLHRVFSVLMKRNDLWVSIDRYGIMRPTKQVPTCPLPHNMYRTSVKEGLELGLPLEDKPQWKTISNWTHWDLNPWKWTLDKEDGLPYVFEDFISENNGTMNDGQSKLQGLISLSDGLDDDGGFCTVPGFHHHLEEWAELTKDTDYAKNSIHNYSLVNVPDEDNLHQQLERITVRAGSLVVWRSEQPHCNYPNQSNNFRLNQYIKMFPSQENGKNVDKRKQMILKMLPSTLEITSLGKKLFGLDPY